MKYPCLRSPEGHRLELQIPGGWYQHWDLECHLHHSKHEFERLENKSTNLQVDLTMPGWMGKCWDIENVQKAERHAYQVEDI